MQIVNQFFWILFFYLLGMGVSLLIDGLIPGSVLGMLFLFAALLSGLLKPKRVSGIASALMNNMVLFFLPATVGLIDSYDIVSRNLLPILAAAAISTILVIAVVGFIQQKMEAIKKDDE